MPDFTSSIEDYWQLRLENCREALEANNFEVFEARDAAEAREIVFETILPVTGARTISWGDSETLYATGLLQALKAHPDLEVLETFDTEAPRDEIIERRRQALLVDLFITGTNALTETGKLVNLDMMGNRVAAIAFGPKNVVILVGRNKTVLDEEEGRHRIMNYAAPVNARRCGKNTPCAEEGYCTDCDSPERICNTWVITEKSFPKGRIKVVWINEELGV
ncbi:lactate utilization protein B/C [candidate division TA06 bacterium SM1_40]|uniref:Lactate utilization protein B/C n=1 Tax=candidate division TA06 bacterium SM1_40 TaxID=1703773 RepID=A0A0S8JC02_UNCT6|nr:MAG: lactate utilization protein B/C [candidate division TA06 bacterium SM1_40]